MIRRWMGVSVVAGAVLALWMNGFSLAEEKAPAAKPAAAATEGKAGEKAGDAPAVEKKPVDPFAVPEGNDTKVLGMFLSRLQRVKPKTQTKAAVVDYLVKMEEVADELLSRDVEGPVIEQAFSYKMSALNYLAMRIGDEDATKRRKEFLAKSAEHTRPEISNMAKQYLKMERIQSMETLAEPERTALVQELAKDIHDGELTGDEIEFAKMSAQILTYMECYDEALSATNLYIKYLDASGSPDAKAAIEDLQESVAKLNMIGKPMDISGQWMDGKPFKLEELKGKVVLIDFWATWCGPCLQELPNVMKEYELYHDKGFEVVGISLDEDREALEAFLKETPLAWGTLHQKDGAGWKDENAVRFNITGIPACFLVDQEGNVVSINCRGENLPKHLAKLLGPVEEKTEAAPEKPAATPKSKKNE